MYFNRRLVVGCGREGLRARGRNSRVAFDEFRCDPAHRLYSKRERNDVHQKNVLHVALEDAGLDSRTDGDTLIRIYRHIRLPAKEFLNGTLDSGHTCLPTHQDDFMDIT